MKQLLEKLLEDQMDMFKPMSPEEYELKNPNLKKLNTTVKFLQDKGYTARLSTEGSGIVISAFNQKWLGQTLNDLLCPLGFSFDGHWMDQDNWTFYVYTID